MISWTGRAEPSRSRMQALLTTAIPGADLATPLDSTRPPASSRRSTKSDQARPTKIVVIPPERRHGGAAGEHDPLVAVEHEGGLVRDVSIQFAEDDERVCLRVVDDGTGRPGDGAPERKRIGMLLMRERIESRGGSMAFDQQPGRGTTITFTLPTGGSSTRASPSSPGPDPMS